MAAKNNQATSWVGWAYFAGILMVLAGIFEGISGLAAVFKDEVLVYGVNNVWLFDATTWGWAHIVLGVILFTAGMSVLNGGTYGRTVGVLLATLSAILNFAALPIYPLWSIILLVVNALIIYALVAHGGEAKA